MRTVKLLTTMGSWRTDTSACSQEKICSPFKRKYSTPFLLQKICFCRIFNLWLKHRGERGKTLFYLTVFWFIDRKNEFFRLVTTIGPFVSFLSIKLLMTIHSWYVYFNLGSQSYLQNAVPFMWTLWENFPEWARNKVINLLVTSTSDVLIFIYWMRKHFIFEITFEAIYKLLISVIKISLILQLEEHIAVFGVAIFCNNSSKIVFIVLGLQHANCCLKLELKGKEGLLCVCQRCFRVSSELLEWLLGASKHKSDGPYHLWIYDSVIKWMLSDSYVSSIFNFLLL